jgi:hypothetical protein
MRSIFARPARPSRRRGVRRREVFSAQFDGGQSSAALCTSIHLGCDVLERRIVLAASPAIDFEFSQGTITKYVGTSDTVEIPSSIGGLPVAIIGEDAFKDNATIKSLVIPDSVTLINDRAFQGMTALESAKIGNGVTYIGSSAFYGAALTAVTIPASVTSIGSTAFFDNANLQRVTIANAKTSIGVYAFADDNPSTPSKLATVSLGNGVTRIGNNAFQGAALTALTIPRTVTSIENSAFYNNANLKSVTIANAKTGIGDSAFASNVKLATVSLGNGITSIEPYAFSNTGLTAVTIPRTVTRIGFYAFESNTSLKSVTIANAKTGIGEGAFANNVKLATVSLGSGVTSIGDSAFLNNHSLKSVTFAAKAPTVGVDAFKGVPFGAKAIRAPGLPGYGPNGAIWNNLIVWTPGAVAAPTVTASTATLAQNAATITIKGTGFVAGKPSAHQVTFNNGAVGTVTAATATRLTVTFSTQPTSDGPLTAIVTSVGGKSGLAKQVAKVVLSPI